MFAFAGCGEPTILIPDTMRVIAVAPSHGTVNVSVDVNAFMFLSHEPQSPTDAAAAVTIRCLGTPDEDRACNAPLALGCPAVQTASSVYESGGGFIRVAPSAPLQANTCYVVSITEGVEAADANVGPLPVTVRSAFQTQAP